MKEQNKLIETLIYFFTPEDSSAMAGNGNLSFDFSLSDLGLGSLKAMFWVLGAVGIMYLASLM
ncbi:MAG: hypothetical protein HUN04_20695 [Desulfobacter sp.]|nr:MAG: hypothetical protein HUN04_20695 [Desulfobacter sp.]